jgi:16S rRNA (adenine1518-N6/adenine1519-N6)-dimethyltransferase
LLEHGARVVAVERDRRCLPRWPSWRRNFPAGSSWSTGDALEGRRAAQAGRRRHVVANLPYNVGTALLLRWLTAEWPPWWQSLTLMFQKEVAERIVAAPGSDAYGRLSVLAQWRCEARIAMPVNRSAFVPPPKVTSAVVPSSPGEHAGGVEPERSSSG